jgi:tetratricopeptide (TPR) repeat protein
MKKQIILIFSLLATLGFAQKKEYRSALKKFNAGDITAAAQILSDNAQILTTADAKLAPSITFLEGKIAASNKEFSVAIEKFNNAAKAGYSASEIDVERQKLIADLVNAAIEDNDKKAFLDGANKLYMAYEIDPENNQDYLYFAASGAVNAQDYVLALKYYLKLKEIKYDGIKTQYFVTEVASGNEIEVSMTEFDLYKKSKDYSNHREAQTESKFPEIVKNIALIYADQGDSEKAMQAVQEARQSNPDDLNLILTEANIYIELDEKEKFQELIKQAIEQDPNNALLYFNLGVVNADLGDPLAARGYYEKAIELDPNYEAAYLNLVSLILGGEKAIVDEMNSLGNSSADDARYDTLKKNREDLYKECVPILENLVALNKNVEAIKTLMNIYGILGENEGFKKMKALLE